MKKTNAGLMSYFPFLVWGKNLTRDSLKADFFAGLTNAVIVLPQGVAYALIAGLPAEYGLYAAIIPALIAALFGSSFHLISGPTAALSIVVFTTLNPLAEPGSAEFIQLALVLTLLAGLFQLAFALARMGALVNFVSHSVVIGFTSGAAVIIASSQIKNLLGISMQTDGSFASIWAGVFQSAADTNFYSLSIALITLLSCILFKVFTPRLPNMLLAMIIGSVVAWSIDAQYHGVDLIGNIPSTLPSFALPELNFENLNILASGAMAIALLGLVEAVSIARSIASQSRQRIDGNQEFIGQSLSNIVGSFFSCYASSGSFTRTGVNYASGARTPMAAIIAAITLAVIMLIFSELTAYIPIPSMAGILMMVAWNLIDQKQIKTILKTRRSEPAILLFTFIATLVVKMEFAIYFGVLLSLVFYLRKTSKPRVSTMVPAKSVDNPLFVEWQEGDKQCPQLKIIRLEGSLFFGAASYLEEVLESYPEKNLLVIGNGMNFIDLSGAEVLEHEARRRQSLGGKLYLTNLKRQVYQFIDENGQLAVIGSENVFENKHQAISGIYAQLDRDVCQQCSHRIFHECKADGDLIAPVEINAVQIKPS